MADVRSLLRNELASRTGTSQTGSTGNRVTKKRKVDTGHDLTRKKLRAGNVEEDQQVSNLNKLQPPSAQAIIEEDVQTERESAGPELPSPAETRQEAIHEPSDESPVPPKESTETSQAIDEDEWAAFERDVVAPTRLPQAPTAAAAAAVTISAAPISTEQLAAQQEKENETLAQAREAQAEGEREDAARFLEDEFDEMEQLEERVRRLKQKREELRQKRAVEDAEAIQVDGSPSPGAESNEQRKDQAGTRNGDDEGDDDVDDDEDDDDWDDWRFR